MIVLRNKGSLMSMQPSPLLPEGLGATPRGGFLPPPSLYYDLLIFVSSQWPPNRLWLVNKTYRPESQPLPFHVEKIGARTNSRIHSLHQKSSLLRSRGSLLPSVLGQLESGNGYSRSDQGPSDRLLRLAPLRSLQSSRIKNAATDYPDS